MALTVKLLFECLLKFYGRSILVGCLMANPVFMYDFKRIVENKSLFKKFCSKLGADSYSKTNVLLAGLVRAVLVWSDLDPIKNSSVGWSCRIRRLRHCWRLRPNECLGYDIRLSDGEAPILEIWGMWNTSLLPLLPCPQTRSGGTC